MSGHFLIVEARFYEDLADAQVEGAEQALKKAGASWERISVPGALEIPAAIAFAETGARHYDGSNFFHSVYFFPFLRAYHASLSSLIENFCSLLQVKPLI